MQKFSTLITCFTKGRLFNTDFHTVMRSHRSKIAEDLAQHGSRLKSDTPLVTSLYLILPFNEMHFRIKVRNIVKLNTDEAIILKISQERET